MDYVRASYVAYAALLTWPVVALFLYSKLSPGQATLCTILGGYLLLPAGVYFKFQMIPTFNKDTIPSLVALLGCTLYAERMPRFFRGLGLAELLIIPIIIGPFITSVLNEDTIRIGDTVLPGVGLYDAGSTAIYEFIFVMPFFIGRQLLRSSDDNVQVLRVMVIAGLCYSLPMLVEVRMSPQLANWIYGYAPDSLATEFRKGGFRPVVFLQNGLLVAFFAMTTTTAAAALWRIRMRIGRWPPAATTGYLSFVLFLCKTLGALSYAAAAVPLVRWASPRLQLRIACILVTLALSYPMLRLANLVPTASILDVVRLVSVDRADSLNTRFVNEEKLLQRAWERPWFGWGRYGRSRVYSGWLGSDSSITDGYWIITLGQFGVIGFVGTFGLLSLSVFRAAAALKYAQTTRDALCIGTLSLIVAFNIVDLLPNASNSPWLWLLTGSLLGRAEQLRAMRTRKVQFKDADLLTSHTAR